MLFKLLIALIITSLFMMHKRSDFRIKPLLHPLLITPLFGFVFIGEGLGMVGFTTGITIGIIVELLWGRQLVDYQKGLKYPLLVSLLTLSLYILSGQISLFFNLFVVVILVYSFQKSLDFSERSKLFPFFIFFFVLIVLFGSALMQELLGIIPVQFLELLSISAGLIPIAGLARLFLDALQPHYLRDNIWYFSYVIAAVFTSLMLNIFNYYALVLFPVIWYGLYYLWCYLVKKLDYKEVLRYSLMFLIVIVTPIISEISSPFKSNLIQYLLWAESVLAFFIVLGYWKFTALEGYLMATLIGLILANLRILV